jgi:CHAT domain-containing protein
VTSIEALCEEAIILLRSDLAAAERLSQQALLLSQSGASPTERAMALRTEAILLWASTKYTAALQRFEQALLLFESAGDEIEQARTRSNAIQTLIYLGLYEQALEWAAIARHIFLKHGEHTRLARLDGNVANLLYRQDRFEEAIALYEDVEQRFALIGQVQDVAAVLRNKAVCQLSLSRFEDALATHARARSLCLDSGMHNLVAEADYNIAYLHFLRGDYLKARNLYETARSRARLASDSYHEALCDLDQAEMYIELNLWEEGQHMAERARASLRRLKMGYEAAKAAVFVGLCLGRQGQRKRALNLLGRARHSFVQENNAVWPALIDLYSALLLDRNSSFSAARARALRALGFFSQTVLPAKAVQCRLLLARLDLDQLKTASAQAHLLAAERLLPFTHSPLLAGHTSVVAARLAQTAGDPTRALHCFEQAQSEFEALRNRLDTEDLRLSFFEDKYPAYESHFLLLADQGLTAEAFHTAERAKSRVLARTTAPKPNASQSQESANLAALCHQLSAAQLNHRTDSLQSALQHRIAGTLARINDSTPDYEKPIPTLQQVSGALSPNTTLIEYFRAGNFFYAFLLGNGQANLARLGRVDKVLELLRFVQFQIGRASRLTGNDSAKDQATTHLTHHLHALYQLLIAPFEQHLTNGHCVIIPHGPLHSLPFHALHDGNKYLGQRLTISVAPSAAIYLEACLPRPNRGQGSAVFGVADGAAPQIQEESLMVASLSQTSQLFLNQEATVERLRRSASSAAHLHIAAHGHFRRDNPWFSSLTLGDGPLSLYDLYELQMSAQLVVLSGCSTGLSVVMGGDEQVGLVRGLLHAGARSALVSLWNVSDASTTYFMKAFYQQALEGQRLASALQQAQHLTREAFPHPFHWAPFSLVGWHGQVDFN